MNVDLDAIYQVIRLAEERSGQVSRFRNCIDGWDALRNDGYVISAASKALHELREYRRNTPVRCDYISPDRHERPRCRCSDPGTIPPCSYCESGKEREEAESADAQKGQPS